MRQEAPRLRRFAAPQSPLQCADFRRAVQPKLAAMNEDAILSRFEPAFPDSDHPSGIDMTRALLLATALTIALPCAAADKGDAEAGKLKVYTCAGCHGIPGWKNPYPNYHVPKIGGQNYDYLVAALTEYKKGERAHPTMRAQGESLDDADIRDIATYLSSLAP
jgi:cytochrome c553